MNEESVPQQNSIEPPPLAGQFRRYVLWALCMQAFLVLVAVAALDRGETMYAFTYAAVSFWAGVISIRMRRPKLESRTDILFLRYGIVLLSLLSYSLSEVVWSLMRGY